MSVVFGCNANVQVGDSCHIFYTTACAFKNTQKDDADRFIRTGRKVSRRLMRMKIIALENAEAENTTIGDEINDESKDKETWTEDLSRILSGICANFSKAVCISTMAHLIGSNNGSRF